MTTRQIQAQLLQITGMKTTASKMQGSMKDYTRFKVKGPGKISDNQGKEIRETFKKCFTDWYTVEIHNSLING